MNRAFLSGVVVVLFAVAAWAVISVLRQTTPSQDKRKAIEQETKTTPVQPVETPQELLLDGSRRTHADSPVDEGGSSSVRTRTLPGHPLPSNGDEIGDGHPEAAEVHAWMDLHDAGLRIIQAKDPNTEPTGTLSRGNLTCDLGETPARYRIQLAAFGGTLLLGEKDDRHRLNRSISMVREIDRRLVIEREVTVTYPRNAQQYGFLFRRQEDTINAVGVVIPEIPLVEGANPYNSVVVVRYGSNVHKFHHDDIGELPVVPLDDNVVLVMGGSRKQGSGVHVLWLRINERGHIRPVESKG